MIVERDGILYWFFGGHWTKSTQMKYMLNLIEYRVALYGGAC